MVQNSQRSVREETKRENDQDIERRRPASKQRIIENAIFCMGDTNFALMYDYKNSFWQQIFFDENADYQGELKFSSVCQVSAKKREFMLTGGCDKDTKEASDACFKFPIAQLKSPKKVSSMKQARYGHALVFINQLVLALGGFNHRDDEAQAPSTLKACEKYSIKEDEWSPIAPMTQERAYFSACRVKEEFVYVFGGFQNYDPTSSIEFYNIMLDKWTLLSICMPLKLAKYGLCKVDDSHLIIAGGLLSESTSSSKTGNQNLSNSMATSYTCVNTVYKFDCNTLKWSKMAKLNFRRTLYSNMPLKENGQIFAIGGTTDGINEVFDSRKKKWNVCQSYTGGLAELGQNDLQTFAIFGI
mmetsp:Transcript_248/g.256  ORF Transcript_248/g.256 Transcript_248/m.256 type:complete len:357 (+) Transcript_248:1060-2130(+)